MVTQEQLRERLGRRPFKSFKVVLSNGEEVRIVRTHQGVATTRDFIVGDPDEHMRWIQLQRIERIEPFEPRKAAS